MADSPELLLRKDGDTVQISGDEVDDEIEAQKISFMELEEWGLYPSVRKWYEAKGLTCLFPWQRDCLRADGVLDGKNLIFSAPTSAGKTMVADILIMKQVFNRRKKVLVVLPFVSIVREKMNDLESMLKGTHIRIGAFMGSFHTKGGFDAVDIAITTFEKANGHVNRLIQENRLDTVGAVIVDEIHLIDDSSRGYLLELMLAKIMMANRQKCSSIQVVGMSATLPNVHDLGTWLDATVYQTDFRPVPLTQMIQLGQKIIHAETREVVETLPSGINDQNKLKFLTMKCVADNISVLVFENNKKGIEESAKLLAKQIGQSAASSRTNESENKRKLREVLQNLQNDGIPIVKAQLTHSSVKVDDDLMQAIEFGVAFHHAGLPMEHREIVEEAFKRGCIKVLFATSTLSSGVNLPARKVIIKTPCDYTGKRMMDVLTYRQMIGRAGRKGMDDIGESILLCDKYQEEIGEKLTKALPTNITSCLSARIADSSACLQRALLEAVVIGLIKTDEQVDDYLNCTLAMSQADDEERELIERQRDHAMTFLTSREHCFVTRAEKDESGAELKPGQLGKAVVAAGLPPAEGLKLMSNLQRARKGVVLSTDLHLLYLIIPEHSVRHLSIESDRLKKFLMDFSQGGEYETFLDVVTILKFSYNSKVLGRQFVEETHYKRFFVALALNDIISEIPIHELRQKYGLEKGALQSLQTHVSMFAGMVSSFCNKVGWSNFELLFRHLEARIEFGVQEDLIELMRIPTMNVRVARRLFDANIHTVREVAHSTSSKILQILESTVELQTTSPLRRLSSLMWIEAHKRVMTLSEIGEHVVLESRTIIEKDIGHKIDWEAGEKVATSQDAFKTPSKGIRKKIRRVTPKRALPTEKICKSFKGKGGSVSLGRNSLYTDENLSTQPDDPTVPPIKGTSIEKSEESPVKSVFSSETSQTSPTTSASSSVAPKTLFSSGKDVIRKRTATPGSPSSGIPRSKRRLHESSVTAHDFSHNVKPERVVVKNVSTEIAMRDMMTIWNKRRFAGIECVVEKCEAIIHEIGSRSAERPTSSDRYDGIIFQDEMKVLTRIAFCFGDNESFSISGRESLTSFGLILKEMVSQQMSVTAFDVKHVYRILKDCFHLERKSLLAIEWFDLKICHWLSDPDAREPSSSLALVKHYSDLEPYVPFMKQLETSVSFHSAIVFPLRECMQKHILNQHNFEQVFRTIEVPVALLMAEAESRGIGVDRTYMSQISKDATSVKKSLEQKARQVAGVKLNMGSIPELKKILYTKLNLLSLISDSDIDKNEWRIRRMKETKGLPEHLSTGKRTLMTLSKYHKFPALVIEYRKIQSARTKTIAHVEEYLSHFQTNRIYSNFSTFSATGRMHMGEPDLQKTQNNFTVMFFQQDGREETRDINVRRVFIPSQGFQFVSADYRQLELRILAHLSQDQKLMQLLNSGGDVFTELAAQINEKESDHVTHDERQHAKTLVYGIIYGMGSLQLSQQLEVSEDEAKDFKDSFHNSFPGIQAYIDTVVNAATQQGHVETLLGRRRLLSCIHSSRSDDRARARRQAVNTTIQGSAADLVKLAMIHLDQEIRERDIPAFLVHEMHDELIYEVREAEVQSFTKLISQTMQNVARDEFPDTFAVDLPVKVRTGRNWGQLDDVTVHL